MNNNHQQNAIALQGNFVIVNWQVSVIGGLENNEPPEPEVFDKILNIVRERSQTEQHALVSLVANPDNFLPVSFLEKGVKQSLAICRIARYFSHAEFINFISEIQQAIANQNNVSNNFDTVDKVVEIFSIPTDIVEEIFRVPSYGILIDSKNPLENLKLITENQLAKVNPIPIGTGFLVGGSHLLTNNHVIGTKEIAVQCVAQFNYVEQVQGYIQKSIDYEFDPILFVTEPSLDYTLVQLKSGMFTRQAGYEFGWAQLIEDDEAVKPGFNWVEFSGARDIIISTLEIGQAAVKDLTDKSYIVKAEAETLVIWHPEGNYNLATIKELGRLMGYEQFAEPSKLVSNSPQNKSEPGDSVIIVQHPKGKQKQIVLDNNDVIGNGLYRDVLRYNAESDYGSSGSPVFNTHWKLVALHHAAIPKSVDAEQPNLQKPLSHASYVAQQGIRICRIIEDLKRKSSNNPKLKSFIQDFVVTTEQLNYPPLPAALEFDGQQSYVSLDGTIIVAFFDYQISRETNSYETTIKLFNQSGVKLRDLKFSYLVQEIAFSPDGETIALAYFDTVLNWGGIKLYNINGKEIPTFQGEKDLVNSISFSPDGQLIASVSNEKTVKLWNLNGQEIQILQGHTEAVNSISFSPDGQLIASASSDKTVKLWNLNGQEIQTLQGHTEAVNSISFSPDGQLIASASSDKTVKLWNLNGQEIQTLQGHTEAVNSISFSPDGQLIASASSDKTLKLWNLNGQEIQTFSGHKHPVYKVSFGSDGTTIASVNYSHLLGGMDGIDTEYLPNEITTLIWGLNGVVLTTLVDLGFLASFNSKAAYFLNKNKPFLPENAESFTIEAWVNPYRSSSLAEAIISSSIPGGFSVGITAFGNIFFDASGNFIYDDFRLPPLYTFNLGAASKAENSDSTYFFPEKVIPFDQFSHIALTYSTTGMRFYLNGEEVPQASPNEVNASIDLTAPILIGAALRGKNDTNGIQLLNGFFSGAIAEVRIWKVALNQEDIQRNLYRRLIGTEANLIGYWRFDEGMSSNRAYNLASANGYGLVCHTHWLSASQAYSLALPYGIKFSGERNQYIDCGNTSLDAPDAIAVEAWVKHKFGNCLIVSRGCYVEEGYSLCWRDGKIRVMFQGKTANEQTVVDTKENAPIDQGWHHIAFTWDVISKEIFIYVDGRQQDCVVMKGPSRTVAAAGSTQTTGLFASSLAGLTTNLLIGTKESQQKYYNVAIAEVRLWKVARTQDQIKMNMTRRLSDRDPDWSNLVGYWRLDNGGQDNTQARNLKSDNNHGEIHGAKWFP